MSARVWIDGRFVPAGEAKIAANDRGFLMGDGAFETMRFETGRLRRWPRHRARLAAALAWLEIAPPDFDAIEPAAAELAEGLETAIIRLTLSRGAHGGGLDAPSGASPTVVMTARPRPAPPVSVSLVTTPARRAGAASERFKLAQYAEPLHARRIAKASGADMGLMVDGGGRPVCADCASLFVISGGDVFTPPVASGALPGTARAALIEAAAGEGIAIGERDVEPGLAGAEAAFVTNAAIGLVAVSSVDGRALAADHPMIAKLSEIERGAL
ncbi:MAG: aminotransferase class IV [Oceanicaulis sp.]